MRSTPRQESDSEPEQPKRIGRQDVDAVTVFVQQLSKQFDLAVDVDERECASIAGHLRACSDLKSRRGVLEALEAHFETRQSKLEQLDRMLQPN